MIQRTREFAPSSAQQKEVPLRRAVNRLKQLVVDQIAPGDAGHLSVMHAAAEDQAQALVGYFCDELGLTSIDVLAVPPAVVTHAGPGVLAVGFFTE